MKIKVNLLEPGENQFSYARPKDSWLEAPLKQLASQGMDLHSKPFRFELGVTNLEPDFVLRGKLNFEAKLTCDRCAEGFGRPIEHRFDLAFVRASGATPQEAEALDQTTFEGDEIDLVPVLEEQFALSLPYQALCSEGCKGICQHCGSNLNTGSCECESKTSESPFNVLKGLKAAE